MSKKASPTLIGIFTLAALVIAAAAAVAFGAGKFFTTSHNVMMYFEKSANGLQVGSDVRFGGVRIGRVESISVLVDRRENRKIIPVIVELQEKDLELISTEAGGGIDFSSFEGVQKAVAQGLRAGLKQQSLVTGQLYIEFDINPDAEGFVYHPTRKALYPVVPTVGTEFDELISGIADGLEKFNALDLDGLVGDMRAAVDSVRDQISGFNAKGISDNLTAITDDVRKITSNEKLTDAIENLDAALAKLDSLAAKADAGIDPVMEDLNQVIIRTDAGVARIEAAADEIAKISNPRAPLQMRMQNVLAETQRTSRALMELSNDLKRSPNALIAGKALPE